MTISPDFRDFSVIFHVIGRLLIGLGLCMIIPVAVALIAGENSPLFDFIVAVLLSVNVGLLLVFFFPLKEEIGTVHTFFIVSLGWIVASLMGAVPLYLSQHYGGFLDAWFEAMSGFATTGLTLVKDLDHMSFAHNLWRHLMMFIGGQGIILASISFLSQAKGSILGFYTSEGREEKILPNIIATARFIWRVSITYLILGVSVLTLFLVNRNFDIATAIIHGFCLFFAAFDTGGFTPHAASIGYYHSPGLETITVVLMFLGAFNFNLHFWVWYRSKKEIIRNFEIKTFLITFFSLLALVFFALSPGNPLLMMRQGFYQLISAHSGCGFSNISVPQLNQFKPLALIAIIFAMMLGGGICSTTGGIKLMRLGVIFKALGIEIKKLMMPHKAVYKDSIHHLQEVIIDDQKVKKAFLIFAFFIFTYIAGAIIAMLYGYSALPSLFESVSAAANVGLSTGITTPSMPTGLKFVYIIQMWLGRLEFLAIFVSLGFIVSLFRK
jgi:trk system potassium uptake protein TrkH